jgi:hypothetical protein
MSARARGQLSGHVYHIRCQGKTNVDAQMDHPSASVYPHGCQGKTKVDKLSTIK